MRKVFIPLDLPKNAKIENLNPSELLTLTGYIQRSAPGYYHILPAGQRVLDRLVYLLDRHLQQSLGAQKISMPSLAPYSIWQASGRVEAMREELMTLKDRTGKKYVLNPTHEESVTQLVGSVSPISSDTLPLLLYQISTKYRDEPRPKHGLLRLKEFIMKDMYSFDTSSDAANETYMNVVKTYSAFFDKLGIDVVRVIGESGMMGGTLSHEFHVLAKCGESRLLLCQHCSQQSQPDSALIDKSARLILDGEENGCDIMCRVCGEEMVERSGIEVGHTFLLGDRYSDIFGAHCVDENGCKRSLVMGCFGIGLSRLLAAFLCGDEVSSLKPAHEESSLSSGEESGRQNPGCDTRMSWPRVLVPYRVCVVPPKNGSRECIEHNADSLCDDLLRHLAEVSALGSDDVLVDDRCHLTIGRRVGDIALLGCPVVIVLGKALRERPQRLELTIEGRTSLVTFEDLIKVIGRYFDGFDS